MSTPLVYTTCVCTYLTRAKGHRSQARLRTVTKLLWLLFTFIAPLLVAGKNVRIKKNGSIDASGGKGGMATFTVQPANGYLRLQNVANKGACWLVSALHALAGNHCMCCSLNSAEPSGIGIA